MPVTITLMSRAKLSAILHLFTYTLEILKMGQYYWDFHVLFKCVVITIFMDVSENAGDRQ